MYGANAFAGVINVVTKQPEQIVAEGKKLGGDARAADVEGRERVSTASSPARMPPATCAGASPPGGMPGDDLPSLDNEPQWDFDPAVYDAVDYTTSRRPEPDVPGRDRGGPREVHRGAARAVLHGHDRRGGELDRDQGDAGRRGARARARQVRLRPDGRWRSASGPAARWTTGWSTSRCPRRTRSSGSSAGARGSPARCRWSTPSPRRDGTGFSGRRSTCRST